MADHAVRLGPAPAADSYLNANSILDAAHATGAEAIHPGYGFLSERASFARACADAGITFVGPSPHTLDVTGDKSAARALALRAGARLVPGTLRPVESEAEATAEGARIGYPLVIKAVAGGGGKGMHIVRDGRNFADALASSQRIALAAFGDGLVYLERLVERSRHVEVQIFGDGHGDVVAIGDRDCSIQRRFQKLIEEAPAPGLEAEVRSRLHADAEAIARAAAYAGAGTVEFLYDPVARDAYFLEVNARLQVEHPVTEMVTGVDLVHAQLHLAAGLPMRDALTLAGWNPSASSHVPPLVAIEARICAEDPGAGWAPSAGRLGIVREPSGPWVRVDSACEPGLDVGIDYDSLLAKVVAWGPTRDIARARLRCALDEHVVTGVATTLPFHRWIVRHPEFAAGAVSTSFLADNWRGVARNSDDQSSAIAAVAVVRAARDVTLANRGPSASVAASEVTAWRLAARREGIRSS
jgi:acetyl/propionyl-CoA carboxylase alpha subunit